MTGSVRAKFKCLSVTPFADGYKGSSVIMEAVVSGSEENKTWSEATPWGRLEMSITNPAAVEAFEVGKEYYLDIHPADA